MHLQKCLPILILVNYLGHLANFVHCLGVAQRMNALMQHLDKLAFDFDSVMQDKEAFAVFSQFQKEIEYNIEPVLFVH